MPLIDTIVQQVNDNIRYHVECPWLPDDDTLTGVTATVDVGTAVVSGILVDADNQGFHYFVSDVTLNDVFNVIFRQTTFRGQVRYDHVNFTIVTNGGFVPASSNPVQTVVGPQGPTGPTGSGGG